MGHSAGGHLALWAAARERLPTLSPVSRHRPFVPATVIALAGVGDLERFSPLIPMICGAGAVEGLTGGAGQTAGADAYREISPAALPAPTARVVMISGILDRLVPPYVARDYVQAVHRGDAIERVDIPGAGHFDLVMSGTVAWAEVKRRIVDALAPRAAQ